MLGSGIATLLTFVTTSLKWLSFHASVGWFIMVMMALSNSSYLSYRNTSSDHRWACSAARRTYRDNIGNFISL